MNTRTFKLLSFATIFSILLMPAHVLAGSMDPTNPPGPTMHSMEDLYQLIVSGSVVITNTITETNTVWMGSTNAPVPKTGQITSYHSGDDGFYQAGFEWPSPRFVIQANSNLVLDNLTGLTWARNANLIDNTRQWVEAIDYCNELDYGDNTDWRLPNRLELLSLIDHEEYGPGLPSEHPFANVMWSNYWSSSTYCNATGFAWWVSMNDGWVVPDHKYDSYYVWPVRGGL
ncbi:MAG: DUF1566 domain-containing protein [Verrucomicrobia bacterium]|nr:DUF1566 domain-containing protein [Verrucomicrobiota bacterium]